MSKKEVDLEKLDKVNGGDTNIPPAKYSKDETVLYWWNNDELFQIYGKITDAPSYFDGRWSYKIHHEKTTIFSGGSSFTVEAEDEHIYESSIIS